jgi:hypothetical protein
MVDSKVCFKCGIEKPLSEFYRAKWMSDGTLGKCKPCTCADVRANRLARKDQYQQYERARAMDPKRVAARIAYQKTDAGKAALYRATKASRQRRPDSWAANCAVNNAIRKGILTKQPCEVCGAGKAHGHHDDYNKPLEVRWLCASHHSQWHKTNTPIPRNQA